MHLGEGISVLIVEDDYLVSEVVKELLEELRYNVVGEASNGLEAVTMAQMLKPDVILMDIKMPDMNGFEATQLIQAYCPTPVVILTAYETPELVEYASEVGAGGYLLKLPSPLELKRVMSIAMARFGNILELRQVNDTLQVQLAKLQQKLSDAKLLSGILPICATCKRIRDAEGRWHEVEVYISGHSQAEFTHGICPDCYKTFYPEFVRDDE